MKHNSPNIVDTSGLYTTRPLGCSEYLFVNKQLVANLVDFKMSRSLWIWLDEGMEIAYCSEPEYDETKLGPYGFWTAKIPVNIFRFYDDASPMKPNLELPSVKYVNVQGH